MYFSSQEEDQAFGALQRKAKWPINHHGSALATDACQVSNYDDGDDGDDDDDNDDDGDGGDDDDGE
jgi:hypothetical protein